MLEGINMRDKDKINKQLIDELVALRQRISTLEKADKELKLREQEIHLIADNVPGLFSHVDKDGHYRFVNEKYREWFGISPKNIIGKHYSQVIGESTYELIRNYIESVLSGQRVRYTQKLPYIHGGSRWVSADYVPDVDDYGDVKGFYALVIDITDRKRAEEERERLQKQLVQSEKLSGLGTLASRIAHEFNNLLQIMRGHSEFALRKMDAKDMEEALRIVLNSSDKASKIIGDLKTFSRKESSKKELYRITEPIEEVLSLTKRQLDRDNIKVVKKFEVAPEVEMEKREVQQVFLNMITNARDAMMPKGGRLEIKVKEVNGKAEVSIRDTGKGIKEEDLNRVFDPFFTTKDVKNGRGGLYGTGLGLSVSYGIVKQHGGEIDVESKPGKGATFTIKLPVRMRNVKEAKNKNC
jgi:PAS domain S-box-containing protein